MADRCGAADAAHPRGRLARPYRRLAARLCRRQRRVACSHRRAMTGRNPSLDLLRGIAILLVVLVHCQEESIGVVPGLSWFAHAFGGLGVQLFFIVSGYTMM